VQVSNHVQPSLQKNLPNPVSAANRCEKAKQWIRAMPGGSQSQLMLSVTGELLVVKFINNPQHCRILANEYIVGRICEHIGLYVPKFSIVEVDTSLIETTRQMTVDHGGGKIEQCRPGFHFGSHHIGLLPGRVLEAIEPNLLQSLSNFHHLWGMLVLDKWTANTDTRQAIFQKRGHARHPRIAFIDHGHSFGGGRWTFHDAPQHGAYPLQQVYNNIRGWQCFEPWLSRIADFDPQTLYNIGQEIPSDWYADDSAALDELFEKLLDRRNKPIALIDSLRRYKKDIFPKWRPALAWG
jgi:hypothetical protein